MDRTYAYYNFISDVNLQRRASALLCCCEFSERLAVVSLGELALWLGTLSLSTPYRQALRVRCSSMMCIQTEGIYVILCFISNSPCTRTLCN
jgi:hypothetical protein